MILALVALLLACRPAVPTTAGPWPEGPLVDDTGSPVGDVPFETVGGAGDTDPSAELFSDDVLPHFEIWLPEESWNSLLARPYTWVEGSITYDGVEYAPVGVRTKGENSWLPLDRKPSLKVKLDWVEPNLRLLGLRELTLNAMNDDHSMMHERVAYRLYRAAGVPAARATHATVTLNDENYGLYTHIETVDRTMLSRWHEDAQGPLFEQHDVDYLDYYIPYFELEFGEDDRSALQGVADAMEVTDPTQRLEAASAWLDYDQFLLYWAVGAWVAQFDGYPYTTPGDDCHVYFNDETGLLEYLPHGVDETFYYPEYDVEYYAGGLLAAACKAQPECVERWRQMVWQVADVAVANDTAAYARMVQEQVAPLIAEDTHQEHGQHYIDYYQQAMLDFIDGRQGVLETYLGPRL